jgi:hypothetical protein
MLPVSAWPPGSPGSGLSPFGSPRQITVGANGYILPKGAWVVQTTTNSVVMNVPPVINYNPARAPGTGMLPGSGSAPCGCARCSQQFLRYNDYVECWRAWQRASGQTNPPIRPLAGRRPPNWFGWTQAPLTNPITVVPSNSGGTVLADGENIHVIGSGFATIIQAFSV